MCSLLFQIHVGYLRDVVVFAELGKWYNCLVCIAETKGEYVVCGMAW